MLRFPLAILFAQWLLQFHQQIAFVVTQRNKTLNSQFLEEVKDL